MPVSAVPILKLKGPGDTKPAPTTLSTPRANVATAPMPDPLLNFAGLSHNDSCSGVPCSNEVPPDPNGDVGVNNYIQAVNSSFAIYSKTGALQAAFTENALWSTGGANPCNGKSAGDPIVLYDTLADRWILANMAFPTTKGAPTAPFYECIAASMTADPVSGGWWLYAFQTDLGLANTPPVGTLNDYAKFGLWTDCLYMAANGFDPSTDTFLGTEFASFSRSDMYAGLPLTWEIGFIANSTDPFTMIPSNLRGTSSAGLPPSGTPDYFVSESKTAFALEVRKFTPGTNCGGGGTLSAPTNVSQTPYSLPAGNSVSQPNTAVGLDPLAGLLMQKVQYRRIGSSESLWVVHTVQTPSASTVSPQWAQIDVSGGTVGATLVQEQIFAPDSTMNRWMGSIAADKDGNVALGYSTSNGASPNFPSIAYVGRLATDPLGTMPQTEVQLAAGAGSQMTTCEGVVCHRWGNYTAMSVDPVDDCTFWYTNEYYSSQANGSSGNWQTRIGSFKFPSCVVTAATYVPMAPVRLLDTRVSNGLAGTFAANVPRTFAVTGRMGVPANAVAVTGNLTVTGQTAAGYVSLTTSATASPTTSSLNFPIGDTRANNVTIPIGATGTLSAVYKAPAGKTAHLIFDVTGYFLGGDSAATYSPVTPARILDSRPSFHIGPYSTPFAANVPREVPVWTQGGIPSTATAVTGNLTVTGQTASGYLTLSNINTSNPATSTLNFPLGDTRANGVSVALTGTGSLWAVYTAPAGQTANVIFDVTGYYVPGLSGLHFFPLNAGRALDGRPSYNIGLAGPFSANLSRALSVDGHLGVPNGAAAITGNLTVTGQTQAGYASMTPDPDNNPPTSTINFPLADPRANGVTVPLNGSGFSSLVYKAASGQTYLLLDITGYFQ